MKTDKNIVELLGEKADFYLEHVCEKITKDELFKKKLNQKMGQAGGAHVVDFAFVV